ncbi:ABC transporter ATP-binding protein [Ancylobacter terrae]|uniref:ABC transporter ATP-binding protein n=1 Tax=Ancylobacter sp. sgz301288 TaxID=3342077 RepID=UPI00385AD1F3
MNPLIELDSVSVAYAGFTALDRFGLAMPAGAALGIVGESGSGKSTVLRAIAGLAPVVAGSIRLDGQPLARRRDMAFHRRVQMVFQDPYGSLHPRQTVDRLLLEPLAIHALDDVDRRIARVLDEVGLGSGFRFRYPHQLSGGQRQRVAIARALILEPTLLLLDEPTSALDASVQAEILNLLEQIRADRALSFLLVSHDLSVVHHMCERLIVMKDGEVVERLSAPDLAAGRAAHPYTQTLISASTGFRRD